MRLIAFLNKMVFAILEYVFPSKCFACSAAVMNVNSFCSTCWLDLNFITKPFCNTCGKAMPFSVAKESNCLQCYHAPPIYSKARAILNFDDKSKKLIHHFKYYDKVALAGVFAANLWALYSNEIKECDVIIPVPMHRLKRMLRFYNHAFILAGEISRLSSKPVYGNVLIKSRWTKSQAKLSKKQRDSNLNKSFMIKNYQLITNKKVILVDDVMTTGSTIGACAKELKKYATSVTVLCIAFTKLS